MNERLFLTRLEAAGPAEFVEMLRRPSPEEDRVLLTYFGAARLEGLRRLALTPTPRGQSRGNVVILHGIMGGELTVYPPLQNAQQIWLNIPRIAMGALGWLRMTPQPASQFKIETTGILKKYYAEMVLGLAADRWNVRSFWYDWRADLAVSADSLRAHIKEWFREDEPVSLVAHSMGGLVARAYILRDEARWKKGGRLIMLGTPNHGSFAIPQVITGASREVRMLALVDLSHSRRDLMNILNTFPGSMQMLPSPLVVPGIERMYEADTWAGYGVTQKLLDIGRQSHQRLAPIADASRMAYIAGCNVPTKSGVADWSKLDNRDGYSDSLNGDGTVPHELGFLYEGATRIPTYFVECEHGALPNHPDVVAGTQQLLAGAPCSLAQKPPQPRGLSSIAVQAEARRDQDRSDEERLRELLPRIRSRARGVGPDREILTAEEVTAGQLLVRGFLSTAPESEAAALSGPRPAATRPGKAATPTAVPPGLTVRVVRGSIADTQFPGGRVDAIAVGHYAGVPPQNAELHLDKAVSGSVDGPEGLIITALHRRGAIPGQLGQNYQFPDPRDQRRLIVLAGMGEIGQFREAELTVLAHELIWSLGRTGCRHLLSVLIGSGTGNLPPKAAFRAWMRGARRALYEAQAGKQPHLETITFVDISPGNFLRLHDSAMSVVGEFSKDPELPLEIRYIKPDGKSLQTAERDALVAAGEDGKRRFKESRRDPADGRKVEAVRLTIGLRKDVYEFAAITGEAAIPQRETQIDPALVEEANNRLPEAPSFAAQFDNGNLLGRLLLPRDLRAALIRPGVPLVLAVDSTTARVHWEMLALQPANGAEGFVREQFLGTACGLTRQLRTKFAPLPEPPLLNGRTLRVLVVADPAADDPLPGAQEEGEAVAAIFEEYARESGREVEVVILSGPAQATRVSVLDQLINHRFDIVHYAGHCQYNAEDPSLSGWVFGAQPLVTLTAHELSRVDRIPRFVFSNACESGITPDRAGLRNANLAPSFAEAFFARGVSDFICTAWPVDDTAALAFARRLYRGMLGLGRPAETLHEAMTAARVEIASLGSAGRQTWGAYQHYGDPNFCI